MLANKYGMAFVDHSFLLTRNLWMATKDKEISEMNPGDVVRITLQTLRKLGRDWGITCDKIILIADQWSREYGGYYTNYLTSAFGGAYKGSRKWITEQVLEDMKSDPNVTEEEVKAAERELAINKVKFEAKRIMKEEFPKIGVYYYGFDGYEFDQIATLAAFQRYSVVNKPDIIVTKDTDLTFSVTPACPFFSLPTKGQEPKVITYDEMYATIPDSLKAKGLSLYQYNAYLNSLGKSHNDMSRSLKPGIDTTTAILHIMDGDYSDLDNVDLFLAQMKSYDLSCYPHLREVQQAIAMDFGTKGKLANLDEFHDFCMKNKVSGISDRYFSDFTNSFDPRLFSKG